MKFIIIFLLLNINIYAKSGLEVVATLPDYEFLAKEIGGDRISVKSIVMGNQDAHFIRPKPSFINMAQDADLLISTGLDLELWLSTVVDKSGNLKIRSGQAGYVAVARGIELLEKPTIISRAEGGVHIYGNPHITCSPLNMRHIAHNIYIGLAKNDPGGEPFYNVRLRDLVSQIDNSLFGDSYSL